MVNLTPLNPTLQQFEFIINSQRNLADSTKQQYLKAIRHYLASGHSLTDTVALTRYANGLKGSSQAFLKSAIRLWSKHLELQVKAEATPDNIAVVQATVYRLEALNQAIQVTLTKGEKAATWLSLREVKNLLEQSDMTTPKGLRDRVALGLLVGAGLRREELVNFEWQNIVLQPVRGKFRTVLNIKGKGSKNRIVPISEQLSNLLDKWSGISGKTGYVVRSILKNGHFGEAISPIGLFKIVNGAGKAIGKPTLAPHDLRRTYAQIGYEAGIPLTQISKLLGHTTVTTTQRYLNLELDIETTISDFIPV